MKYTLVLEDTPTGAVRVSTDDLTMLKVGEVAKGFTQGTPAFDYLVACMNTCQLRSKGIQRDEEARVRQGLILPVRLLGGDN